MHLRYVLPFFSDDVTFSHNGLYRTARGVDSIDVGAVLKQVVRTFSVFARGRYVFDLDVVYNGSKWRTHRGAKCDVSDCLVAAAYMKYRTDGRAYKVRPNFQTRAVLMRSFLGDRL